MIAVHLFDSLYGEVPTYDAFARAGGILRSVYTPLWGHRHQQYQLANAAFSPAFGGHYLRGCHVAQPRRGHWRVDRQPRWRNLGRARLRTGGSSKVDLHLIHWRHPSSNPSNPTALRPTVRWRQTAGNQGIDTWIEGSADGVTWTELGHTTAAALDVPASAYLRARQANSNPSDAYAGSGDQWLVVDGFDRVLGGSWTQPTHDFAATRRRSPWRGRVVGEQRKPSPTG